MPIGTITHIIFSLTNTCQRALLLRMKYPLVIQACKNTKNNKEVREAHEDHTILKIHRLGFIGEGFLADFSHLKARFDINTEEVI